MKYYFASKMNFDEQILYPRIPHHRMNIENSNTRRICCSESIFGCLTAIGGFDVGDIIYLHICESNNVGHPNFKDVPDVAFTGEKWILEPVKMELLTRIKITEMIDTSIGGLSNPQYGFDVILEEESDEAS